MDDNKLLSMKTVGGSMMEAAYRTQENFAAQVFVNADQTSFTKGGDTYTWALSCDAVPFVYDSHLSKSGKNTDYLDNKGTSTLDGGSFETGSIAMTNFTDDTGNDGSYFYDTLLVGQDNAKVALELANSDKKPLVANNEYNVYQGTFEVVVWKKFKKQSGKSYAPWMLIDSTAMRENLYFLDRIKPETNSHGNFETMSWAIGVYARFAICVYDWKWVYGSIPA
jgi:hypothetical protein